MQTIKNIPISKLTLTKNVRQVAPLDQGILDLAQSMGENGQEVEIRVYPLNGAYVVTAGHRRVMAALHLGWDTIRAVVDKPPADEISMLVNQTIENEHRVGMGYIEKARVYARLKELGLSQRQIAQRFAVSDADVSLALSTLRAVPALQQAVEDGRIKPSAIEPLLSQPAEVQEVLAEKAIREKTVRKVSALVKAYNIYQEADAMDTNEHPEDIPEDADPLEFIAVEALQEALDHLSLVRETGIRHPELRKMARLTVEQLVQQAASIKKFLDGNTWDDTKDLV